MMCIPRAMTPPWTGADTVTGKRKRERSDRIPMVNQARAGRGFTLMELLTVMAIIGILAAMATPSFQKSVIRAKEASLRRTLFIMRDVIDQHYADHGAYPDTLATLAEKHYIREVPKDPFTGSRDSWILMYPEEPGMTGIWDIHSGSDRISLSGEPYNEW